jgi:hypothetical protein
MLTCPRVLCGKFNIEIHLNSKSIFFYNHYSHFFFNFWKNIKIFPKFIKALIVYLLIHLEANCFNLFT